VREPVTVAIGFRLDPQVVDSIAAVDPRIRIVQLPDAFWGDPSALTPELREQSKAALAEAEVLLATGRVPADLLEGAERLRWYQVITAGVDRMAAEGLLQRGFTVTNVRGMAAPGMAEYVIAAMLMLAKGLHICIQDQQKHEWKFRFTGELTGKTLGIVGMGAIGRETARRARAFGMRIIATRRTVAEGEQDADCDEMLPYTRLGRVLSESDYVALCLPLTPETRQAIGREELALMKRSACLINVARGPVVDQEALIEALSEGRIAGAALDVFDPEPLPPDSPLWDMPNVIVTPHISGAIEGYGHRAAGVFIANLRRYLAGEPLENVVNTELGY
jgi:D-2-hydroxyacid dehydrogenase (NADP+)